MQDLDFGILLNLAFGAFKDEMRAHMRAAGFQDLGSSFGYIFRLLGARPQSLSQVAEALGITPQGTLKIVDEMIGKGYVARRADPDDGRVKLLVLTTRGEKALGEARRFHRRFERELTDKIGKSRSAAVRTALEAIVDGAATGSRSPRPL